PAAARLRRRVTDALRDLRSPRGGRPIPDVASVERAPRRARAPGRAPDRSPLRLAPPRPRRKSRVPRSEASRLGRDHRQGRALAVSAGGSITSLAQSEGAQGVRIRDRGVHRAERRAPAPRRASRRPLRRTEAALRGQSRDRLYARDARHPRDEARTAADGEAAIRSGAANERRDLVAAD